MFTTRISNEPTHTITVTYTDTGGVWTRIPLGKSIDVVWNSPRGHRSIKCNVLYTEFVGIPPVGSTCVIVPTLHVFVVSTDDSEEYKSLVRPKVKEWASNVAGKRGHEYLIIHATSEARPKFLNIKMSLADRMRTDFRKEHVCVFRFDDSDTTDLVMKIGERVLVAFEAIVSELSESISRIDAQRQVPGWNFCQFFVLKENLALCFDALALYDDAFVQYEELEAVYSETRDSQVTFSTFGGDNDDMPACLFSDPSKPFRELISTNDISILDFRFYLIKQQLTLLWRQGNILELMSRSTLFLREFDKLFGYAVTLPLFFAESFILSFVNSVLSLCESEVLNIRPEPSGLINLEAAKIDLLFLACGALDRIGLIYGEQFFLPTLASKIQGTTETLKCPIGAACVASKESFLNVFQHFVESGLAAAKLCKKEKVALSFRLSYANILFCNNRIEEAAVLLHECSLTYFSCGWANIDRSILRQLAKCNEILGRTRKYISVSLKLLASYILFQTGPPHVMANKHVRSNEILARTNSVAWLSDVSIERTEGILLANLAISSASLQERLIVASDLQLENVNVVSRITESFILDEVRLTFVGGETSDVAFVAYNVEICEGKNIVPLKLEKASTSGMYLAERVVMRCKQIVFQCDLIKEKRKHTLNIHELVGPLSIGLTKQQGDDTCTFCVQLTGRNAPIENCTLAIRCLSDNVVESASINNVLEKEGLKFKVPEFSGSVDIVVRMKSPFSFASFKFVCEYSCESCTRTVSVSDTINKTMAPCVSVVVKEKLVLVEVKNLQRSPLIIEDVILNLNVPSLPVYYSKQSLIYLQTFTFLYSLENIVPTLSGTVKVAHRYLADDVSQAVKTILIEKSNNSLIFNYLWNIWENIIINTDWDKVLINKAMLCEPPKTVWDSVPRNLGNIDQMMEICSFVGSEFKTISPDKFNGENRIAEYQVLQEMSPESIEYSFVFKRKCSVGVPCNCILKLVRKKSPWENNECLKTVYTIESQEWAIVGMAKKHVEISDEICIHLYLVALVGGQINVPRVMFDIHSVCVGSSVVQVNPLQSRTLILLNKQ